MDEIDKTSNPLKFKILHNKEDRFPKEKFEYDNVFLRRLIDNSIINTFGILEASKIEYELNLNTKKEFEIKTTKKFEEKIITSIILINNNTEEDLRIKFFKI